MDTSVMVILIVVVFAVLIAFVAVGQRKGGNAEPLPAAPLSAKEQAKRGRVEKAYLVGAGPPRARHVQGDLPQWRNPA